MEIPQSCTITNITSHSGALLKRTTYLQNVICQMVAILFRPQCAPPGAETVLSDNKVNIMVADALAPYVTRPSATLILTACSTNIFVFLRSEFQQLTIFQCPEKNEKWKHIFIFSRKYSAPHRMKGPLGTRAPFQYKDNLFRYRDFHYKDKSIWDCLIFLMGIPILGRWCLRTETNPIRTKIATRAPIQYKDVILPV